MISMNQLRFNSLRFSETHNCRIYFSLNFKWVKFQEKSMQASNFNKMFSRLVVTNDKRVTKYL